MAQVVPFSRRRQAVEAAVRPDGRTARAERTRAAIVDALFALLEDGVLQPRTDAIAARAGVSERTIFQHFPDREALLVAVAERQGQRVMAMYEPIRSDGPLDARIDALVAQRAKVWEAVAPMRRAAELVEPFSDVIAGGLKTFRAFNRSQVEHVFKVELERLSDADRATVVDAAAAASEWTAWKELRFHQGRSPAAARRAMRRILVGLLTDH
jgi:TetR/AcrR family transcriptional regulator of autoinduction and epiphytic fitness